MLTSMVLCAIWHCGALWCEQVNKGETVGGWVVNSEIQGCGLCLFPCGVKRGWNPGRGGHLVCQASLELLMELGGVIWKRVEAVDRYVSCICIYV